MTLVCDHNFLVLFQYLRPSGHHPPYSETGSGNHMSDYPLAPGIWSGLKWISVASGRVYFFKTSSNNWNQQEKLILTSCLRQNKTRDEIQSFQTLLTSQSLPVTLRTTRFNIQVFYLVITLSLRVIYGSQNEQHLFRYMTWTNCFS